MLRHITKADIDGSAALIFLIGGVGPGELRCMAAFCSKATTESRDAALAAVRAFAFFFVILDGLKNVFGNHMSAQHKASRYLPLEAAASREGTLVPACTSVVFRGYPGLFQGKHETSGIADEKPKNNKATSTLFAHCVSSWDNCRTYMDIAESSH